MGGRKIIEDSDDEEQEVSAVTGPLGEPEASPASEWRVSSTVDATRSPMSKVMNDSGQPSTGSTGKSLSQAASSLFAGLTQSKSV